MAEPEADKPPTGYRVPTTQEKAACTRAAKIKQTVEGELSEIAHREAQCAVERVRLEKLLAIVKADYDNLNAIFKDGYWFIKL